MIWLNGDIVSPEAAIDARDRGLLLGESLFETILVEKSHPYFWKPHIERLKKGCALLGFDMPNNDAMLAAARDQLVAQNKSDQLVAQNKSDRLVAQNKSDRLALRLSVTGGAGGRGLVASETVASNWMMQISPAPTAPDFLNLHISTIIRQADHPLAEVKTGNCLDTILARRAALAAGADEAILLNQYGRIAGCAAANIYLIDAKSAGRQVLTPPVAEGALPGIMRQQLLVADAVREAPITPDMLIEARGLMVSNSLLGVVGAALHARSTKKQAAQACAGELTLVIRETV